MQKSHIFGAAGVVAVAAVGTLTFVIVDHNASVREEALTKAYAAGGRPAEYGLLPSLNSPSLPPPEDARIVMPAVAPPNVRFDGGIAPTAAPGVAFSYSYAFRLPNGNIAGVQELHAQACEKLGIDRCRITGMRYTVSAKDDVRAMLSFKLAPDLARQFGKDGIAAIQKAQGSLVDAAISGDDRATGITQSQRRSASLESRVRALEVRLRQTTRAPERLEIQSEIDALHTELDRESQSRADAGEALANTPMVFQYNSGSALSTSVIGESWGTAVNGFTGIIGFFIIALGILLPWLLLIGIGWLAWRRLRKSGAALASSATP